MHMHRVFCQRFFTGPVEAVENAEYFANNISKFMQVQEQKVLEIARKHVTHMKEKFDQEKCILNEKISDLEIENNKLSGNVGFLEDYIEVLKAENKKLKVETENHSQFKINSISYMEEALTESQENAVKLEKNAEKEVIDEPLQLKINCISFSPIVHSRNENFRHPEFNQNLSRNRNELTETYMNASSTLAFRGDQVQKIKNSYQENEYEPCAPESSKNRRNKLRKYQQWTPRISFWDHRVLLLGMFFCLIVSFLVFIKLHDNKKYV